MTHISAASLLGTDRFEPPWLCSLVSAKCPQLPEESSPLLMKPPPQLPNPSSMPTPSHLQTTLPVPTCGPPFSRGTPCLRGAHSRAACGTSPTEQCAQCSPGVHHHPAVGCISHLHSPLTLQFKVSRRQRETF